jgi:CheY-like chemotaxis protein
MAKILIVDDRPLNREFLTSLLKYSSHHLLEAANGKEALAIIQSESPDLVISDILMPGMDGLELARQLHANPATARIPIMFYSATYLEPEARALGAAAGVRYVLTKPAEPAAILAMIRAALQDDSDVSEASASEGLMPDDPLLVVSGKLTSKMEVLDNYSHRLTELMDLGLRLTFLRDPERLLYSACDAAREIVGARYAAIGLMADNGRSMSHFVHSGMDPETVAQIGSAPVGKGILGKLIHKRLPLRIRDIASDPDSAGFPEGHPVMHSFLGVPIAAAMVFGRLYLTEKIGAPEFSDDDEKLAVCLATQLAVAYENARLYEEIQRHAARLQLEVAAHQQAQAATQAQRSKTE